MTVDRSPPSLPEAVDPLQRAAGYSAWGLYSLIVLEILFMVSPFAAYYYAAYGIPLNALADAPATAWLTWQVLPHFAYNSSVLVNGLILIAWPLILVGLLLFLWGFVQIYRARFGGRGPVTGGLYRHIRHPQYLALAVVGLGTTLYWSRFLVIAAYVLMLAIYGLLARLEEALCLRRFGAPYAAYLERTGRFLPRAWETKLGRMWPQLALTPVQRLGLGFVLLASLLTAALGGAWLLRQHALASIQVETGFGHTAVYLAPMAAGDRRQVLAHAVQALDKPARLLYVVPAHWTVPELGLAASGPDLENGRAYATTHGNRGGFDRERIRVLVTEPELAGPASTGRAQLARAVRVTPHAVLTLDLTTDALTMDDPPGPGRWQGVPVPLF